VSLRGFGAIRPREISLPRHRVRKDHLEQRAGAVTRLDVELARLA
jgi:hypothetical protein